MSVGWGGEGGGVCSDLPLAVSRASKQLIDRWLLHRIDTKCLYYRF